MDHTLPKQSGGWGVEAVKDIYVYPLVHDAGKGYADIPSGRKIHSSKRPKTYVLAEIVPDPSTRIASPRER
jgi:hypothetical protein